MWVKGLARCSWQKGSLPTVQISVSFNRLVSQVSLVFLLVLSTYGLEVLALLVVEAAALESNDLWGSVGVVGNGRAALRAKEAVDGLARGSGARPLLDGAVDGQGILGDNDDESCVC